MKETKEHWFLSSSPAAALPQTKFEEDADKIQEYYREEGYVQSRVGTPEIKTSKKATDKETRWVRCAFRSPRARATSVGGSSRRQHVIKTEFLQAALQAEARRVLLGKERAQGLREGA